MQEVTRQMSGLGAEVRNVPMRSIHWGIQLLPPEKVLQVGSAALTGWLCWLLILRNPNRPYTAW